MNHGVRLQSVQRDYLMAAYELGEVKDKNGVTPAEILELLDLSEEKGDRVLEFLVEAGLVVWPAKGELLLTEVGLEKAEELAYGPRRLVIEPLRQTQVSLPHQQRRLRPALSYLPPARAVELADRETQSKVFLASI